MVDQVVLARLDMRWGRKVDSICFAHGLDVIVWAGQTLDVGMKVGKVLFDYLWRVSVWVGRDEDWCQNVAALGLDCINHLGHFVKFVGTDVGTMREAKVHLQSVC